MSAQRRPWETVYLTVQPLVLNVINLGTTWYIARTQGAANYGYWLTATALTSALLVFCSFGTRPILVRSLAREPDTAPVQVGEQLTLRTLLSAIAAVIAVTTCLLLRHPPIVVACVLLSSVGLMLGGLTETFIDTLHAFGRFTAYANVFMVSGLVVALGSVLVCWMGGGLVALALAYLAGPVINAVGMGALIAKDQFRFRPRWNTARFREILRESRLLAGGRVLAAVLERLEQLVLPTLIPPGQFGKFGAGLIPASRLNVIPSGVSTYFYPRIARASKAGAGGSRGEVKAMILALLVCCLPTTLGVLLFGPWFAHTLFPDDPAVSSQVIAITIWSLPIIALNWALVSALQAAGHHDDQARADIAGSVVSFVVGLGLLFAFGLPGACVSWLLRSAVTCALLSRPFVRVFPGLLRELPFVRLALAGAVMHGTMVLGRWLLGGRFPALCAVGLVGSGAFFGALLAMRVISVDTLKGFLPGRRGRDDSERAAAGGA